MSRHTTFRFCLDLTVEQQAVLARHAGAARFAFNRSLRTVKTALAQRKIDPDSAIPWSGFDLINAFNAWKKTEAAGRVFAVDGDGVVVTVVTGLAWRGQVCQQVFEEAAVDCGTALKAWSDSRSGKRRGTRVGFPRFKRKTAAVPSFRLRNKHPGNGKPAIRVGDCDRPRSITLPNIGQVAVHDDTRRLRRMLAKHRAKILFATISRHAGRWWIALNVEAADLHPAHHHEPGRDPTDRGGWVGIDRGLSALLVAARGDGTELARITDPPNALAAGLSQQRRLAKSLSRKQKGSNRRKAAAARLGRHHNHVANVRKYFLYQVSGELVKTHDRLVIEDLHVAGMLRNHHLARAISDAAWGELARQLRYKQAWRGGTLAVADRWFPSSQICSVCGDRNRGLILADRVFTCGNGHRLDRDTNAAVNLAHWGQQNLHRSPDPQAGGRANNVRRRDGADQHPACAGETVPDDAGTDAPAAPRPELTTPEKGGADQPTTVFRHALS